QDGASVVSLEMSGDKGVVQVNGKALAPNSSVILNGGDEVVFSSSGKHSYIFQQLPHVSFTSCSTKETQIESVKEIPLDIRIADSSAIDGASILASFPSLSKDLATVRCSRPNGTAGFAGVSSELDVSGGVLKKIEDKRERHIKEIDSRVNLPSNRGQVFKDDLRKGILNASDIDVSFECFPYHLRNIFLKSTILLSGPTGPSSRDPESPPKESSKSDKLTSLLAKQRAALADISQFKRPTATVDADIVGSSSCNLHSLPKQESSTATSKPYIFKEGMTYCSVVDKLFNMSCNLIFLAILNYAGLLFDLENSVAFLGDRVRYIGPSNPMGFSHALRGPNFGFLGNVLLAFEENGSSKIGVRFDKKVVEGNDLGGLCEEDHGFFCSADFLRLESGGGEDSEKLAINELIEVASEESNHGPLIIFIKEIEKSLGVTDSSSSWKGKLESLPAGILIIGSHIQTDNRKEKVV
ncbi:hypothetical protein HPP92_013714, partial [Vanilla planifolia]